MTTKPEVKPEETAADPEQYIYRFFIPVEVTATKYPTGDWTIDSVNVDDESEGERWVEVDFDGKATELPLPGMPDHLADIDWPAWEFGF